MQSQQPTPRLSFVHLLSDNRPQAMAWVRGNASYPAISGLVKFYDTPYGGVLVEAEVFGLPNVTVPGSSDFYAMHIHQFGDCSDNIANVGDHYNPSMQFHPFHAGDLLPLMGNQGYAWSAFYDKRFRVADILNRSVVIHHHQDDFHSQPSGNPGAAIGCGVIRRA
ncbi:MAG: superoxide dismutase family protein [Eubacteriales bacterium]|nr:superoxide dismutase family protein [Eubacteriales bacterium]